ncbi:TFIIB-type zinc ribbon-containing protein [Ideonella livida]|uniref:Transcription factor zinc-finger domain-containing protein n=1 Tax=Ideonella livida TaxID=2707176 RepID=A0A7C9THD8_9BURK|nr:zf-TFIIB domain-containing protein [Ideonella livida]NDY90338.1 hypothetical protein [Ideonella livida]
MQCPVCPDTTLLMSERQGVEIDYCPRCRGVWLDRGELDKLIALSQQQAMAATAATPAAAPAYAPPPAPAHAPVPGAHAQPGYPPQGRRPDFEDSDYHKHHGGYRRKSWLSDLFD